MEAGNIDTEAVRLEALRQYQILDTEPEEAYNNLARLAAFICDTPISLVIFIDENRLWFKAKVGLDVSEMPRSVGLSDLCQEQGQVVVISDTLADEKLANNPVVTGYPYIRFYAGVPLITPKGDILGTLCAIDQVPRQLSQKQVEAFVGLSRLVIDQLELRRYVAEVSQVTEKLMAHEQSANTQSEALRESEERWQLALHGNNDGIWDWNFKTNEVFFSTRWKEMLGYKDYEVSNRWDEWTKRIHPDERDRVLQAFQDHFAKKTPFYVCEYRVQCEDGSYKWILDRGQALWDALGDIVRMVGSYTDITDVYDELRLRKRADEELKRQNLRSQLFSEITLKIRESLQIDEILQTTVTEVQKLLQADRVLIFRLETDGSGTVVQEAVLPGWPVILGKNIFDPCFKEEYIERYRQGRVSAIEDIEAAHIQICHRKFLQQFAVRANLVVPILVRDAIWGLLLAHQCAAPRQWNQFETDLLQQLANQIGIALSQAQLLEKETQQTQELTRSNAELEQFAYVASHDLQEPLRMVTSYLQLLERRYKNKLDANADQFITYAVDGASRMQTLINDLLNYSRVSTRAQPFVPVDCSAVLEQVLANLQVAIADSRAIVTYDTLPELIADTTQLIQVFQNLIANAIKFCRHQQPRIEIGVGSRGAEEQGSNQFKIQNLKFKIKELLPNAQCPMPNQNEYLFWVRDNGIGLESQYAERIFIIFQRLHGRDKYPGTGIGLAICKKIIERHGGRIWVESKPGQGSTFYFTIPDRAKLNRQNVN
ncbi:GAF domain-containing protein [Nostoc sp. NMS4]|uniref:GAF domain-containing protein n=1 Tax=Nostoc sp. NMS4 TaxID=2815390 RepID=UPI0026001AEA|nr:GAF domain-containing protein [Nostoc sp. NMS4]MBN3924928.1 GAF domain-containing protein [Nostoc sp. NMS4]